MSRDDGLIELDRAIDSIHIGARHRTDLGDLDALCASIQRVGLLQPVTITPDGVLVCGRRRLAAVTQLGWRTVRVWVRSGISSRAQHLFAERDENGVREPLPPSDAAALYEELRALLAEDASRRQAEARFGASATQQLPTVPESGAVQWTGPSGPGETRLQAAKLVTGSDSHTRLDRVLEIQRLVADPQVTAAVREIAQQELAAMDQDRTVAGHYATAMVAALTDQFSQLTTDQHRPLDAREEAASWASTLSQSAELTSAQRLHLVDRARAALSHLATHPNAAEPAGSDTAAEPARGRGSSRRRSPTSTPDAPGPDGTVAESSQGSARGGSKNRPLARLRSPRAFRLMWSELAGWDEAYDPAVIGPALSDEQWDQFVRTVRATTTFLELATQAREAARNRGPAPAA